MDEQNKLQNSSATTEPEVGKKNKWSLKKKLLVGLSSVAIVIVGLVLVVNAATGPAVKVSNQLVAYIQAEDANGAYSLLSSDARDATDKQEFTAVIEQIGPILTGKPDMQSKEIFAETGKASTAKVVYDIKGSDSITYSFTVNLIKEGEDWKVLNFESTKKDKADTNESTVSIDNDAKNSCMKEMDDDTLCTFAGAFAKTADYKTFMSSSTNGVTTTIKIEVSENGNSSMSVSEGGAVVATIVTYDGATYIQDSSDGQWIRYSSTNTDAPEVLDIRKEFAKNDFKNDNGQREEYNNLGKETLDGEEVYKYQIVDPDYPDNKRYMWFSADTFLLRKIIMSDDTTDSTMTFTYVPVEITEPTPVKETI